MKVFFVNTELVAESTPAIFVPTADNMFDGKFVLADTPAGQPIRFGSMESFASVRFRVLPGKTYKFKRIGNSDTNYGVRAVFADIDGNAIEPYSGAYLTTFTVPENQSIAYVYTCCNTFNDNNNKQLELSEMEPVIE